MAAIPRSLTASGIAAIMGGMGDALIRCENLSFAYEGRAVLEGLTFSVEEGDRLCVAGANGSGKSTLLKGLAGLIPAAAGRLVKSPALKNGGAGYLPQESPPRKDFPATVFEVVLSGRQNRRGLPPFYTRADKAAAEENLEMLGLAPLRRVCFRELSGGQRRRALLARALCAAGKILLLDEPASGLDPLFQGDLYRALERAGAERGLAVVMTTHDIEGALRFTAPETAGGAGKALHLAGRQVFFGSAAAYRD